MSNLPSTSHEANRAATLEMRQNHWAKIKAALLVLKLATGEEISVEAKMDYHAVVRRLSEMERLEMIYKPGTKKPTKTNRLAFQYAIRTPDTVLPTPEKHYLEGECSASDFASKLIATAENHQKGKDKIISYREQDLFGFEK